MKRVFSRSLLLTVLIGSLLAQYVRAQAAECEAWPIDVIRSRATAAIAALGETEQALWLAGMARDVSKREGLTLAAPLVPKAQDIARRDMLSENAVQQMSAFIQAAIIGEAVYKIGLQSDAVAWLEEAANIARGLPADEHNAAPNRQSEALAIIAASMGLIGLADHAAALFAESIALAGQLERFGLSSAEENKSSRLADIASEQARSQSIEATRTLEQAIAAAWQIPITPGVFGPDAFTRLLKLKLIVTTMIQMKNREGALSLARKLFDPATRVRSLAEVARAYAAEQDTLRAEAIAQEALRIAPYAVGIGSLWYSALGDAAVDIAAAGFPALARSLLPILRTSTDGDIDDVSSRDNDALLPIARAFARKNDVANAEQALSELPQIDAKRAETLWAVAAELLILGETSEGHRWKERALMVPGGQAHSDRYDERLSAAIIDLSGRDAKGAMILLEEIMSPRARVTTEISLLRIAWEAGLLPTAQARLCQILDENLSVSDTVSALTAIYVVSSHAGSSKFPPSNSMPDGPSAREAPVSAR